MKVNQFNNKLYTSCVMCLLFFHTILFTVLVKCQLQYFSHQLNASYSIFHTRYLIILNVNSLFLYWIPCMLCEPLLLLGLTASSRLWSAGGCRPQTPTTAGSSSTGQLTPCGSRTWTLCSTTTRSSVWAVEKSSNSQMYVSGRHGSMPYFGQLVFSWTPCSTTTRSSVWAVGKSSNSQMYVSVRHGSMPYFGQLVFSWFLSNLVNYQHALTFSHWNRL